MKKHFLFRQPDGDVRLGDYLKTQLADEKAGWTQLRAAVAFVKRSGIQHLLPALASFASHATVKISVGVDLGGTSEEGLRLLLDSVVPAGGEVWVFHNDDEELRPTFHPKVYLFKRADRALLIVGSGNITAGGLFSNYEAGIVVELDLSDKDDQALLKEAESTLDAWCNPDQGLARLLDKDFLDQLVAAGMIPPEAKARGDEPAEGEDRQPGERAKKPALFGKVKVKRPPAATKAEPPKPKLAGTGRYRGFLMTLQQTDVGVGQTTAGTSRRSPEIFIPLAARDEDHDFWGWPRLFKEDATKKGKYDRFAVRMRIGGSTAQVNMMTWPDKHDFRLRSEVLRSAGSVGDILRIERAEVGSGFDYYVEIIPRGTSEYAKRQAQCTRRVKNSKKWYGYY